METITHAVIEVQRLEQVLILVTEDIRRQVVRNGSYNNVNKSDYREWSGRQRSIGSAEALVVTTNKSTPPRFYVQCRYCDQWHWSDECPKYRNVEERKKQLRDSCYKCLKVGHMSKDCKKVKACVYCGDVNTHHRRLCPKKFKSSVTSVHLTEEIQENRKDSDSSQENVLVSSEEMVLMQTAKTEIKGQRNSKLPKQRLKVKEIQKVR